MTGVLHLPWQDAVVVAGMALLGGGALLLNLRWLRTLSTAQAYSFQHERNRALTRAVRLGRVSTGLLVTWLAMGLLQTYHLAAREARVEPPEPKARTSTAAETPPAQRPQQIHTADQARPYGRVHTSNGKSLIIRSKPGGTAIGQLPAGESVHLEQEYSIGPENWVLAQASNGTRGWAVKRYIHVDTEYTK